MSAGATYPLGQLALTAFLTALLTICPLPGWLAPARPDWLGLFIIYWVTRAPQHVGLLTAWCLGVLLDGFAGGLLGPHALAGTVMAYLAMVLRPRMLHYALAQQMAVVAVLCGTGSFLAHWAQGLGGRPSLNLWFLMGSLTSAACWPIVGARGGPGRRMEAWDAV
jgi:rod shape-determining protein MreD